MKRINTIILMLFITHMLLAQEVGVSRSYFVLYDNDANSYDGFGLSYEHPVHGHLAIDFTVDRYENKVNRKAHGLAAKTRIYTSQNLVGLYLGTGLRYLRTDYHKPNNVLGVLESGIKLLIKRISILIEASLNFGVNKSDNGGFHFRFGAGYRF